MIARFAVGVALLLVPGSALAQAMNADAARKFVTGKLFAFNCVNGSRGLGRIYADGSVIGTIQSKPSAPTKSVWLPPGTLRAKGDAICATLKGLSFEPCFNLTRTGHESFRGAVSGMSMIAYCDFTRRTSVAGLNGRAHVPEPVLLDPPTASAQERK